MNKRFALWPVNIRGNFCIVAIVKDGSITAWGRSDYGGTGAPNGNDYTKIYSTSRAFAALKADGSIKAWGAPGFGTIGVPWQQRHTQLNKSWCSHYQRAHMCSHYQRAYPRFHARNNFGGYYNAPNHPNYYAFATLQEDGSITAWGRSDYGGTGAPNGNDYTKIYSTSRAFAAQ
jgi:alpha-tubulin suppressor-like RCC1 family protein